LEELVDPLNRPASGRARVGTRHADTKVAGINLDKITGKAGRTAVDILEETTRPLHAMAAGTRENIKALREGRLTFSGDEALEGLKKERTDTFSDVLKDVGVKDKTTREVLGFALDVAADPTTYLTLGAGVPAKVAAKGATKAAGKKVSKGASRVPEKTRAGGRENLERTVARALAKKAERELPQNRGLQVGIVGKSTSGKTTAKVSKALGISGAAKQVRQSRAARGLEERLPIRPADIDEEAWQALKAADRARRGTILHGTRHAANRGRGIRKALGGHHRRLLPERDVAGGKLTVRPRRRSPAPATASAKVRDAIERMDFSGLTAGERMAAHEVMEQQETLLRLRRQSGEDAARYAPRSGDEPEGYVFRQLAAELDPQARRQMKRSRSATPARPTTTLEDFTRTDRRPMAEVRETDPDKFVEDLELTLRAKTLKDLTRAANTRFRSEVLATGRRLTPKAKWDRKTEGVYTVKDGRLVEVSHKSFAAGKPDDFVILKKAVADHANRAIEGTGRIPFLDAATSTLKWWLTVPNPQYHTRNTYGGVFNAWQSGVPARDLVRDTPTAVRVNRRMAKQHRAEETLGRQLPPDAELPVLPGGKTMRADDFIAELERVNIAGGGLTKELSNAEFRRRRAVQAFEDYPRIVAYISWRMKGHAPEEAARRTLRSQFDYGDLTSTEEAWMRRLVPFWTFRSRNTVHQIRTLLQRPGRMATVEKARDSAAAIAGLPEDWEEHLSESEKLGVPIPVPVKRDGETVLAFPGLPITDLNLLTDDPGAFLSQVASSGHPGIKAALEFGVNYSFFFREPIERPGSKWFSAPDELIDNLPREWRAELEDEGIIRMGRDRWTGEETWQWRGKTDYLSKLLPVTSVAMQALTSGRSRKGQTRIERGIGHATGVRPQPHDPKRNRLFDLYDERERVEDAIDDLEELRAHKRKGWDADKHSGQPGWDTPEYAKLKRSRDKLAEAIYRLEGQLGKKDRTRPQTLPDPNANPYKQSSGGMKNNPYQQRNPAGSNPYAVGR
jgi:hypothetical protein